MKLKTLLCLVLILSCQHKTPVEPNGEMPLPQWPMFGGNLRNTSNAADPVEYYSGPQQGNIIWTLNFEPREVCFTSPSIASDGTIYMATTRQSVGDSGFVYAINPEGNIKWRFTTERGFGSQATGAVGKDDTYFIGSSDRYFYAINREGKLKWKKQFSFVFNRQRPAITEGGEVILSIASGIIAFNASSGDTLWFHESASRVAHGISIDRNGNIYAGTSTGLLSLSPFGEKRWEFPTTALPIIEPVIAADGTILFTVTDSLLYGLNPNGSLKWTFNLLGSSVSNVPAIASDGSLITMGLGSGKIHQRLYKLNSNAQLLWSTEMTQLIGRDGGFLRDTHPIIDRDGTIYMAIGSFGGDNFFAITSNGQVKWSITIEESFVLIFPIPAISPDGTLYVAGDRSLNAIR